MGSNKEMSKIAIIKKKKERNRLLYLGSGKSTAGHLSSSYITLCRLHLHLAALSPLRTAIQMAVIWYLRMMKPVIVCQAWLRTGAKEAAEVMPNPRQAKLIFKNRNGKQKEKPLRK